MVKFLLLIFLVILYPLIEGNKSVKIVSNIEVTPLEIVEGRFFVYEDNLSKSGSFFKLFYKNRYEAIKLNLKDYKNGEFSAKKAVYFDNKLKSFNLVFKGKNYTLTTKEAIYFTNSGIIRGEEFVLNSKEFNAKGKGFEINRSNLSAKEIAAVIKDER